MKSDNHIDHLKQLIQENEKSIEEMKKLAAELSDRSNASWMKHHGSTTGRENAGPSRERD